MVDQVTPIDIQHGTNRDELTEANIFAQAPIQNGSTQRPALANKAYASAPRYGTCESGIQAGGRTHHAEAVRADDAHLPLVGVLQYLSFQLGARLPGLFEPRRDNNGAFHSCLHTFADDSGNGRRWRDHYGQVDRLGYGGDVWICLDAQDAGVFGVDRKDGPTEGGTDEIPDDRSPHTAGCLTCSNHRDGFRRKDRLQCLMPIMQNIVGGIQNRRNGLIHFSLLMISGRRPERCSRM